MNGILMELHPFCTPDYLQQSILAYFHARLCQQSKIDEDEYIALIRTLFPDGLNDDGLYEDPEQGRYHEYLSSYHNICNQNKSSKPKPFQDIQSAKQFARSYLFWVLDTEADPFGKLPRQNRNTLFQRYHHVKANRIASAMIDYYLGNDEQLQLDPYSIDSATDSPFLVKTVDGNHYIAEIMQDIASNEAYNELSEDIKDHVHGSIREIKVQQHTEGYFPVYRIDDLFTLLFIECQGMNDAGIDVRRCLLCNRYFAVENAIVRYCERPLNDDEYDDSTCRTVGAQETAKRKRQKDPAQYAYSKGYRTHYARIKAGKLTKDEFMTWSAEARRRLAAVHKDPTRLPAFEIWLKES